MRQTKRDSYINKVAPPPPSLPPQILAGPAYLLVYIAFIAFFNYYYTFLQLDPVNVSDQLKRQGASIPMVRPGKATAAYITDVSIADLVERNPS